MCHCMHEKHGWHQVTAAVYQIPQFLDDSWLWTQVEGMVILFVYLLGVELADM